LDDEVVACDEDDMGGAGRDGGAEVTEDDDATDAEPGAELDDDSLFPIVS
jgi:hypothetical protein